MMALVRASGAVIFRHADGELQFLVVESRLRAGSWGLVKGKIEGGETEYQAARREIAEEVGLSAVTFLSGFREEVRYTLPSGDEKIVVYFLSETDGVEISLQEEELSDYRWLSYPIVCHTLSFPETCRVVRNAVCHLAGIFS